jgi:hypothetical protein
MLTLLRGQNQHCLGVVVTIVQQGAPFDFIKSVDPNESYGKDIVLIVLKEDVSTTIL